MDHCTFLCLVFLILSRLFMVVVPRRYFFCGSFAFVVPCVSHTFASVHCCLMVACWERTDLLALVGDVYCIFVFSPCGKGLGVVLDCIVRDLCRLSYLNSSSKLEHMEQLVKSCLALLTLRALLARQLVLLLWFQCLKADT